MPNSFSKKMKELRRVVKLHATWLVYATLGEASISKAELEELVKYKKLPMGSSLELVDKSYLLGRLKAILRKSEFRKVSFEEAVEAAEDMKLSTLEELVLEQARLKAGSYLKNVAAEMTNGVFDSLSASLGHAISEASVKDIVSEETELALIYKKTAQQFASDLATRLQTGHKKNWTQVAKTELHRAKVAGHAQAIINKVDIYNNSDGPASKVSVIPGAACCDDCTAQYTDGKGTPLIFTLSTLVSAGSNADPGVSHTRRNGKHTNWKTTLPPLHPNCGCQLVYIPAGYGWDAGKLVLQDKEVFEKSLSKAIDKPGKSEGGVAKVDPVGPPRTAEPPKPPSAPGVAGAGGGAAHVGAKAPALPAPAGGKPAFSSPFAPGTKAPASTTDPVVDCPLGGDCPDGGKHHQNSSVMAEHTAMAQNAGGGASTEVTHDQIHKQAEAYGTTKHKTQELVTHLSTGKITAAKALGKKQEGGEGGVQLSYKAAYEGNGEGCTKPPPVWPESIYDGGHGDGLATVPKDEGHKGEVGAYLLSSSFGLDHVPVTVARAHDGSAGIPHVGDVSVQSWQEGYKPQTTHAILRQAKDLTELLKCIPEAHRDTISKKLQEIACLDFIMNNNDRHFDNLVWAEDLSDVKAIDHGLCFGSGMDGQKNSIMSQLNKDGKDLSIPDHLYTRFKNQSLEQTTRSLESAKLQSWQIVQTHIRMKYMVHLQDTYGFIPPETNRYAVGNAANKPGETRMFMVGGYGWRDGTAIDGMMEADALYSENKMPDQLFASFAKEYLSGGQDSDLTPDEQKRLSESPVILASGTGFRGKDADLKSPAARAEQEKYFQKIPPYKAGYYDKIVDRPKTRPIRISPETPVAAEKQLVAETPVAKKKQLVAETPVAKKKQLTELERAHTALHISNDITTPEGEYLVDDADMHALTSEEIKNLPEKKPKKLKKGLFLQEVNKKFLLDITEKE